MDSCDEQDDQSWLTFSLSNQNYYAGPPPPPPPTTSHPHYHHNFSLFQHHPLSPGEVGQPVDNGANTHQHHELPFLGVSGGLLQAGLFPAVTVAADGCGIVYKAAPDQKTVEASFLGGFSCEQQVQQQPQQQQQQQRIIQNDAHNQQQLALVASSTISNKKGAEGFGHRTSIYRGVTRHRWTGRYEAHLWDNSCRREGQSRKGRQVYLGGYDKEEKAARAYDLAALKYWGPTTTTNFPLSDYEKELEEMKNMSRQEFVASLRRKSSGFSRGASIYRGVTRYIYNRGHHQHGRWQARIGRVAGNKDLYLGTFSTQEEAAEAYDIAAIKFRGLNAVTNFDISRYDVNSIISSNLPVGGMSNKAKSISGNTSDDIKPLDTIKSNGQDFSTAFPLLPPALNFAIPNKPLTSSQNYEIPALGTFDQTQQSKSIGYDLGYSNDGVSQGYNGNYCHEGRNDNDEGTASGSGNSWIVTPSLHSLQTPKASLSVLHRAIFGVE